MQHWVIPEKIHTSTVEGMVENLMGRGGGWELGGGGYGAGNPDGWGALNLKISFDCFNR